MIGLLQRVSQASVVTDRDTIAAIDQGLLVLVGIEKDDTPDTAARLAERLLGYRVFVDHAGRMNRSLLDINGGLLLVPQFTLAASTDKGRRPSFAQAAPADAAAPLFQALVQICRERHPQVTSGRFGAHMQVALVNDGPVTFWLKS